ncbi:MAG TPA: S-methyl-5-thioribose-1-phosphate isomerase [Pseudonocardiaceae bacterium]|nr:S-methyl-5-thioribose-1-phosphate isomerase [Pseudonocardiaceae bacterium]
MRSVEWVDGGLEVTDQTALPQLRQVRLTTVDEVVDAVRRLVVRGAPLLGVVGALGVALAARSCDPAQVRRDAERIAAARPTAVNLRWGVSQALARLDDGPAAVLDAALAVLEDDVRRCRSLAGRGAQLLAELCGDRPLALHTHCNAGAMACVEWGTALGIVRALHERDLVRLVVLDETRPLLQGSRITAVELAQLGVPHRVVVDSAGPSVIARGLVDAVVVGADRIAANGDVANKIGTYPLALAAARAGVPFVVAAPESTVDAATASGAGIEVEERPAQEVLWLAGRPVSPPGTLAWNPAFDVTPADLITAIVTEERVIRPSAP